MYAALIQNVAHTADCLLFVNTSWHAVTAATGPFLDRRRRAVLTTDGRRSTWWDPRQRFPWSDRINKLHCFVNSNQNISTGTMYLRLGTGGVSNSRLSNRLHPRVPRLKELQFFIFIKCLFS